MKSIQLKAALLIGLASLTVATAPARAQTVLIDWSTSGTLAAPDANGNYWNSLGANGIGNDVAATVLKDSSTNANTAWSVAADLVGNTSNNTGAGFGGTGINGPSGANPFNTGATLDGMYANYNAYGTATITFTGLAASTQYDFSLIGGRTITSSDGIIKVITGTADGNAVVNTLLGADAAANSYMLAKDGTALNFSVTSNGSGSIAFKFFEAQMDTDGGTNATLNALRLAPAVSDNDPPTLAGSAIVDDQAAGPVEAGTRVTYTVTFSEDINGSTVSSADFDNAGSAAISFGPITETPPGVFIVEVTPTTSGTLQLRVPTTATIEDPAGNALVSDPAILDDTTITVTPDSTPPTLAGTDIVDDQSGSQIPIDSIVTYTVTFSEDIDSGTVSAADFANNGSSAISFGTITETSPGVFTVAVTPTAIGTLQLRIAADATITDVSGLALATSPAITDDTTFTVTENGVPSLTIVKIAALPDVQLIENTRDDAYVTNPPISSSNSLGQKFSLARAATVSGLIVPVSSPTATGDLTLEFYNLSNEVGNPAATPLHSYTASLPAGVVAGDLLQFNLPDTLSFGKGSYMIALTSANAQLTLKTNEGYLGGHLMEKNSGTGNQWANTGNSSLDLNFSLLGAFDSAPSRPSPSSGPNIIHIMVDDFGLTEHTVPALVQGIAETDGYTRADYLSDFYETPTIQALSNEGLNFTWSYTQPNCAPSRAALMSGQYSPRSGNGVYNVDSLKRAGGQTTYLDAPNQGGNDENTSTEPDDDYMNGQSGSVPLAQALYNTGYVTCHIGKYHVGSGDASSPSNVTNQGIEFNYGGNNNGNPAGFIASGTPRKWPTNVGSELNPFAQNYSQAYVDRHLNPVKSAGHDPDTLVGTSKHLTDGTGDAFIDFMNNHRAGETSGYPVYMQLHFYATHTPIVPRPDLQTKYQNKAAPSTPQTDGKRADFAALAENMDQTVARVLRYLDDPNGDGDTGDSIAGETLVVWTTDNGGEEPSTENLPLRGRKGQHLEGGIRVPMIMRMPGTIPQGAVTDTLVHTIDMYPTFLDFSAGVANSPNPAAATHKLDGESLYAHALDPGNVPRDRSPIFYHFPGYLDTRAYPASMEIKDVGGQRYKYIYNYDPYYGTIDDYGGQRPDQYQLYNLSRDPRETLNLLDYIDIENGTDANDNSTSREYWDYLAHKGKADTMAADLHAWLTQPGADWNPIYATYRSNFPAGPTRAGKANGQATGPAPAQTPAANLVPAPAGFSFTANVPVSLGGNDLEFTFDSHAGFAYRIEASNTLSAGSWLDISGRITATSETTVITINDPSFENEEKRFYRIALIE